MPIHPPFAWQFIDIAYIFIQAHANQGYVYLQIIKIVFSCTCKVHFGITLFAFLYGNVAASNLLNTQELHISTTLHHQHL
jgi:hypothetical protein